MKRFAKYMFAFCFGFYAMLKTTVAQAAVTLPMELPVADVETLAGLALVGLGVMWSIRKIIKTINRS